MQQPSNENASNENAACSNDDLEKHSVDLFEDLADEVILGMCFEVHRAVKLGILFLDEPKEDEKKYEIVDEIGLDVFGQVPLKKQFECVCPNCQRNLAASRFAPHLEKCMGMGRNSSRIASKRIANSGKVESDVDDYDNDSDWNYSSDRKSSKKRKDKHSPRRVKAKSKNGESASSVVSSEAHILSTYESMSKEGRKELLMQMCGVISEHTKKMCTRSHRCPQHTDEQRKALRLILLGPQGTSLPDASDDVHVDVDTFDETDSHSLHENVGRMWDAGSSTNPSPADSNSTNNSNNNNNNCFSNKKKEKKTQGNSSNRSTAVKKAKPKPGTSGLVSSSGGHGSIESL